MCDHMTATHCPALLESLSIHKVPVNWSLKSLSIREFSVLMQIGNWLALSRLFLQVVLKVETERKTIDCFRLSLADFVFVPLSILAFYFFAAK